MGDGLAICRAFVFTVCFMALLFVIHAAILVLGPVCRRAAKSRPAKRCATARAPIVDL